MPKITATVIRLSAEDCAALKRAAQADERSISSFTRRIIVEWLERKPVREQRIDTLFDAIAHGSAEHRAWLKKAIGDHFAGRSTEKPRD